MLHFLIRIYDQFNVGAILDHRKTNIINNRKIPGYDIEKFTRERILRGIMLKILSGKNVTFIERHSQNTT